jgi:hypothetical protein
LVLRILHPSGRGEFAAVRALNFLILAFCLYAFSNFWKAVAEWDRRGANGRIPIADASPFGWMLLGYVLFFSKVVWLTDEVTPDLLVAGIVLLTSAQLFGLNAPPTGIARYVRLGLLLAVGFYAKAILFYFGLFVLLALTVRGFRSRHYRQPIAAGLVFALFISPFAVALTHTLGHFTVGDSGRLNYSWFVDGTETKTWMSDSGVGAPLPFYPGRISLAFPRVFDVPHLEGVTYAPWYDPARFDKASLQTFNLRGQVRQITTNLRHLKEELSGAESALIVCLVILAWSAPRAFFQRLAAAWFCILPVVLIIGMYVLVHLVDRFMLGFSLVLWGVSYACVRIPPDLRFLARRALVSGAMVFAACTVPGLLHYLYSSHTESVERDRIIAEALPNFGVRQSDRVAVIGEGQEAYWAHWAQVSIVAELWSIDSGPFWSGSAQLQEEVIASMEQSGAKTVIWRRNSGAPCPRGWVSLPEYAGCIVVLRPPP